MATVAGYERPVTLDAALELLSRRDSVRSPAGQA